MKLVIEIKADNAAFEEGRNLELSRILRSLANKLQWTLDDADGVFPIRLTDSNGNIVGECQASES